MAIETLASTGRILGVDAGGSRTKVALVEGGKVAEVWEVEPLNALLQPAVRGRLASLIEQVRPDAAGVGLPGISNDERAGSLAAQLRADCNLPVFAATDLTIAWLGAFVGRPGIVVVSGTGSFAVGGYRRGSLQRTGGHGYLLGDQGGAYWLGKRALQAALADLDGTGPATSLRRLVEQHSGQPLPELVRLVHQHPTDRSLLAQLAPLVEVAARPSPASPPGATTTATTPPHTDPDPDPTPTHPDPTPRYTGTDPTPTHTDPDPVAAGIIEEAAEALVALVRPLQRRFGALPVAAGGGTLTGILRQQLAERITCCQPVAEPVIGAVLLAAGTDIPLTP